MRIEAMVNGRVMKLEVKKQYHNGTENVYECQDENGVWVAVEEKTVVNKIAGIKTRFDYTGGEDRGVWVTIKANTEEEVNVAHGILEEIANKHGYDLCKCGNAELEKGKWVFPEFIGVDEPGEAQDIKVLVYEEFKQAVA